MKKLLIVVDYQKDFVDGSLGFPGAELLDERIAEKINAYRENGDEVVFTYDTHPKNYLQRQEGRLLPIEHCMQGTPGHELYGKTREARRDHDKEFLKPTFGSADLFHWLYKRQVQADVALPSGLAESLPFEAIELCGLVSNICVISNVVLAKTACPEVPIIVDALATASHDPEMNEKALDIMEGIQVQVINR